MTSTYQNLTIEVRARKAAEHLTAGALGRLVIEDHTPERYREIAEILETAAAQCRKAGSAKAMADTSTHRLIVIEVRG